MFRRGLALAMIAGGGMLMGVIIYRMLVMPGTLNTAEASIASVVLVGGAAVWWEASK